MKRNITMSTLFDQTLWIGRLKGYRVMAFGREQVLNATIEIHIRQEWINPIVWSARAYPGSSEPCAMAATAEECQAKVEALFVELVDPWAAFTAPGLFGRRKITPQLVYDSHRKVS